MKRLIALLTLVLLGVMLVACAAAAIYLGKKKEGK